MAVRCSVTENKSDMLNDKAIAQCTNSGGMIVCEYLQVPDSITARVRDGDGRTSGGLSISTIPSAQSIRKDHE